MTTARPAPLDRDGGKPARILAAAEELVIKRGFKGVTIADIAERAHVGKGTVYLYWRTKESLFLGLLARSFLAVLGELVEEVRERPELARPDLLCPHLIRSALRRPLVRALHTSDTDVLGALADDPRSRALAGRQGTPALMRSLLPVWRRHGLARTDWDPERQAYAVQMLAVGYLQTTATARSGVVGPPDETVRDETVSAAVAAVLGSAPPSAADTAEIAREVVAALEQARDALRASVDAPE